MIPLTVDVRSPEIKSADRSLLSGGSQTSTRSGKPALPKKVGVGEMTPLTVDVRSPEIKSADMSLFSSGSQTGTRNGKPIMPTKVRVMALV